MSAPNENSPGRLARRRRRWTALAVTVVVAVVALAVVALLPRSATATASLTVTPRTAAGAGAAVLLADRYSALAGSPATLRAARDGDPALAGSSLDELVAGTAVEHPAGTATITVRETLAGRETAAAAANAVVGVLVQAGAAENLVAVDRGAEATPSRATTSPDRLRWSAVAVLIALACGLATAALHRRWTGAAAADPRPERRSVAGRSAGGDEVLDDLPGFLEHPPGSPPVPPAAPAPVPHSGTGARLAPVSRRRAVSSGRARLATAAVGVLLIAVAGAAGVVVGRAGNHPRTAAGTGGASGPTAAAASDSAAAALAFQSVPLGSDGVAASVTFSGLLLEQRAVGLTVTYPSVSVTTDGRRSLAHVRLPTFNCLTAEPPADPLAAGCARALTEYADLASPQLQVSRDGDRIELDGLFPTYTRSNGSPPGYTGRAYQLSAAITAGAPEGDGRALASGLLRIGLDSAPSTGDPAVNVVQLPS